MRPTVVLLAIVFAGCNTVSQFAVQHTVGAQLGACGGAMDSVRAERGDPWKTVVGDEENVSEGTQTFQHEWGYLLPGADSVPRADSLNVVVFRWGHGVRACEIRDRRLRRGSRTLPWDTDS